MEAQGFTDPIQEDLVKPETQEANTAVIEPSKTADTLFPDTLLKANEFVYKQKQAQQAKTDAEIAKNAEKMNFSTADMLPEDAANIAKQQQVFMDKFVNGGDLSAFNPSAPDYLQKNLAMKQWYAQNVQYPIDVAKTYKTMYDGYGKALNDTKEIST